MPLVSDIGHRTLRSAGLPHAVDMVCRVALARPGRLFDASPLWSRLFLAWVEALAAPSYAYDAFLPAAVACEFMAAGYDLLDAATDHDLSPEKHAHTRAASDTLLRLSHGLLVSLDTQPARRASATAALARAGRRACAGHTRDLDLRRQTTVSQGAVLAVLRRRSGTLVAAPASWPRSWPAPPGARSPWPGSLAMPWVAPRNSRTTLATWRRTSVAGARRSRCCSRGSILTSLRWRTQRRGC
jgi:hypothetical protein